MGVSVHVVMFEALRSFMCVLSSIMLYLCVHVKAGIPEVGKIMCEFLIVCVSQQLVLHEVEFCY